MIADNKQSRIPVQKRINVQYQSVIP